MTARIYTRQEIADYERDSHAKGMRSISPSSPEPNSELIMIKAGRTLAPLPIEAPPAWADTLEQPVSLTMRDYLYQIPLHLVAPSIVNARIEGEWSRISAVKRRGRQPSSSPDWVDATPERLAQAADHDLDVDTSDLPSPSGFATGVKYRKIDSPFDIALKREWIRERHYMAGAKFWKVLHGAGASSRLIADLNRNGTGSSGSPSDYRMHCQDELNRALAALPPKYRDKFFDWAYRGLSEDVSVASLGAAFSRSKHLSSQLRMAKIILAEVLEILAKSWGL